MDKKDEDVGDPPLYPEFDANLTLNVSIGPITSSTYQPPSDEPRYVPRAVSDRGVPWRDMEPNNLYDGYSRSYGDGIISFTQPISDIMPDLRAYFALVYRVLTGALLFKTPILTNEILMGAHLLEEERKGDRGIFLDREATMLKLPDARSSVPIWSELSNEGAAVALRKLEDGRPFYPYTPGSGLQGDGVELLKTNVRAVWPCYTRPLDEPSLLRLAANLYSTYRHIVTRRLYQETDRQIERSIYDSLGKEFRNGRLVPEDLKPKKATREEIAAWGFNHHSDESSDSDWDSSDAEF
ncbi:hypothetical protein IAT38_003435 [Cryptococcus sp. DSM 104549]